jgi:hypothetical protein
MAEVEAVKRVIERELVSLDGSRYSISVEEDPDWGYVYIITLESSSRRALEVNLELQKKLPGVAIVVRWTGETDLSEEELAEFVRRISRAGGFRARAPRGFSSVEAVREVRE